MGAVIKVSNGGSKGATSGLENYLKQEQKTDKSLMYGKDCDANDFTKDFKATKELYGKTDGRQHTHFIQSWREGEVTPQQAHEIGQAFLEHEKFKGFQAVCITHKDREHVHNHIVINSVSLENGKKYDQSKQDLQNLKNFSNELNLSRGIEPEKKLEKDGEIRVYDNKFKYEIIKEHFEGKAKSYVVDTALAVEKALEKSTSRNEFIGLMSEQGYKTIWTEEKKHITFENQQGEKVRLSNLEKTFSNSKYSKEGLLNEFKRLEKARGHENNFDWSRTANIHENERGGISKLTGNEVTRSIQQQVRAVEERTDRALGKQQGTSQGTQQNNARDIERINEEKRRDEERKRKLERELSRGYSR